MSFDSCKLTQLSDCLMITILSYLDATSLYQLGRTCVYFNNIVKDKKLWHIINARNEPNTNEKINYVLERVHEKTRHLLLRGQGKKTRIHKGFFYNLWDNITVLALEAQKIDGNFVSMCNLPSSLTELSLKKSVVKDSLSFFKYSDSHMANLRVLILNECSWLESNFLMSTAKYPNLEILSIVNCHQLQINLTPYFSVARYGFNKIKLIDCRFTTMSHDFLRGFMLKKSLICLYFQSMRSYQLDMNVPLFPKILEKTQKLTPYKIEEIQRLSIGNSSLYEFKFHHSSGLSEELPQSILYEYPYPRCTCKLEKNSEKVWDSKENENEKSDENIDDFIRFDRDSQKFICKKHLIHVQSLPNECIQSFFGKNKRLLHPSDSSDTSSSDSDSDIETKRCCIYGRTNGTKMIVMKINGNGSIDDEVIDIPPPPASHINPLERQPTRCETKQPSKNSGPVTVLHIFRNESPAGTSSTFGNSRTSISGNSSDSIPGNGGKNTSENSGQGTGNSGPSAPGNSGDNTPGNSIHGISGNSGQNTSGNNGESSSGNSGENIFGNSGQNISGKSGKSTSGNSGISNDCVYDTPGPSTSRENPSPRKRKSDDLDSDTNAKRFKSNDASELMQAAGSGQNRVNQQQAERQNFPEIQVIRAHLPIPGQLRPNLAEPANFFNAQVVLRPLRDAQMVFNRGELLLEGRGGKEPKRLNLRQLSVRGYRKVDNKALEYLRHLNLDLLDVTYTNVTKEGVENFLVYNPNCRVVHKDFCVCKPRIPT